MDFLQFFTVLSQESKYKKRNRMKSVHYSELLNLSTNTDMSQTKKNLLHSQLPSSITVRNWGN